LKKSGGISPFHPDSLWRSVTLYRTAFPGSSIVEKLLFNPSTEALSRLLNNYSTAFSGSFFFVLGSGHPDHNPNNVPNIALYAFPFILLSAFMLWEKRKHVETQVLLLWLFVAPLVPSFTIQPEHTVRLSPIFPLLDLMTGFGIILLLERVKHVSLRKFAVVLIAIVVTTSALRYMTQYLGLAQTAEVSHEKYHLLAAAITKYRTPNNEVVTQSPSSSPYIWYIFDTQMQPQTLWQSIVRYPEDAEHFRHVHRIGNVTFESIQWPDIIARAKEHPITLIFEPREVSGDMRMNGAILPVENIQDRFGNTVYEVWSVQ
jgi:hypothetical protein